MKKLILLTLIYTCLWSCQNAPSIQNNYQKEIGETIDQFQENYQKLEADKIGSLLTDDSYIMGIDPSENWDKNALIKYLKKANLDIPEPAFQKNIVEENIQRIFRFSDDNAQATVIDHAKVNYSKMLLRRTTILENKGGEWKISFINTALITDKSDLPKIDTVIEGDYSFLDLKWLANFYS